MTTKHEPLPSIYFESPTLQKSNIVTGGLGSAQLITLGYGGEAAPTPPPTPMPDPAPTALPSPRIHLTLLGHWPAGDQNYGSGVGGWQIQTGAPAPAIHLPEASDYWAVMVRPEYRPPVSNKTPVQTQLAVVQPLPQVHKQFLVPLVAPAPQESCDLQERFAASQAQDRLTLLKMDYSVFFPRFG